MGDQRKSLHEQAIEWQRERIAERLALCTQQQQDFFRRLYPAGPKEDQLSTAYDQIERTIAKNEKRETETEPTP